MGRLEHLRVHGRRAVTAILVSDRHNPATLVVTFREGGFQAPATSAPSARS